MELYINAFAHYIPETRIPNSYFKEVNGLDDEWIFSRTGIKTRSKAGEEENPRLAPRLSTPWKSCKDTLP